MKIYLNAYNMPLWISDLQNIPKHLPSAVQKANVGHSTPCSNSPKNINEIAAAMLIHYMPTHAHYSHGERFVEKSSTQLGR